MAETLIPNNREEHWLKGMVDGSTTLTPNKRQEYWYQEIINAQGGGGGGGMTVVIDFDADTTAMDKTWGEIFDAISHGTVVQFLGKTVNDEDYVGYFGNGLSYIEQRGESYYVIAIKDVESNSLFTFSTTTTNGYPVLNND